MAYNYGLSNGHVTDDVINQSINSLITEMSKRTYTCEKHKAVKYK